jgi:hypothetical protein
MKQSLAEGLSAGHLFDLFATSFRTVAKLVAIKSPEAMADNEDFRSCPQFRLLGTDRLFSGMFLLFVLVKHYAQDYS